MALSATEIEYVLHEIAPVLVQGRIQKIHQPGDRLLLFDIRMPGKRIGCSFPPNLKPHDYICCPAR